MSSGVVLMGEERTVNIQMDQFIPVTPEPEDETKVIEGKSWNIWFIM